MMLHFRFHSRRSWTCRRWAKELRCSKEHAHNFGLAQCPRRTVVQFSFTESGKIPGRDNRKGGRSYGRGLNFTVWPVVLRPPGAALPIFRFFEDILYHVLAAVCSDDVIVCPANSISNDEIFSKIRINDGDQLNSTWLMVNSSLGVPLELVVTLQVIISLRYSLKRISLQWFEFSDIEGKIDHGHDARSLLNALGKKHYKQTSSLCSLFFSCHRFLIPSTEEREEYRSFPTQSELLRGAYTFILCMAKNCDLVYRTAQVGVC